MHVLVIATSVYLAIALVVFARRRPEYSHIRHTISELGEQGSPIEKPVAFGLFLPVGLAATYVAFASRSNEPAALLAAALALGYIGGAFFPIDPGAPMSGSRRNGIHNLAAGFSYIGAIAAFELAGREMGFPFTAAKLVIVTFLISAYLPGIREIRGLLQRLVEFGLHVGLFALLIVQQSPDSL